MINKELNVDQPCLDGIRLNYKPFQTCTLVRYHKFSKYKQTTNTKIAFNLKDQNRYNTVLENTGIISKLHDTIFKTYCNTYKSPKIQNSYILQHKNFLTCS